MGLGAKFKIMKQVKMGKKHGIVQDQSSNGKVYNSVFENNKKVHMWCGGKQIIKDGKRIGDF